MTSTLFPILRKPAWLKRKIPGGESYSDVAKIIREKNLHTVCESAHCPNLEECWNRGTATFMILGNICTRGCRFCDVPKGKPVGYDLDEPLRVLESVKQMKLKHIVLTSVDRDDLPDQGTDVWVKTIELIREKAAPCTVEALIPDMQGNERLLQQIFDSKPHILNHNFETVKRLQKKIRGRANLKDSSTVLELAKKSGLITKTSFMLGMGETQEEILEMIHHCASLKIDIVTFGQYMQPTRSHYPVSEYLHPEKFQFYKEYALENGIRVCESGPLVRSSFKAEQVKAIFNLL